jgi:hypothetical protein
MKNKLFILILLVLFVTVLITSCFWGDIPKAVKEKDIKSAEYKVNVKDVGVIENGYILTWDAGGTNIINYEIYAKKEDNASVIKLGSATNKFTYTSGDNTEALKFTQNTNIGDKWTYAISSRAFTTKKADGKDDTGKTKYIYWDYDGDYYFGIRAYSTSTDYSSITWTKDKRNITVPKDYREKFPEYYDSNDYDNDYLGYL